jgi:hypothetical protein
LFVSQGFTNLGLIELTCVNAATQARLDVTSGTLVNAGGGTIRSSVAAGGDRQLNAALDNQGTLTVAQTLSMNSSGSVDSNSGTITLTSGDLSINSSPNFHTTGAIDLGARTLTISGGSFNFDAGSVTGTGTLALSGTTASFTPDFSNATTTLTVNNSIINGPGTLTNVAGRTLTLTSSTINAALVNQGAIVIRAGDTISGSFTTTADSTLTVQGDGFFSNAILFVSQGFTTPPPRPGWTSPAARWSMPGAAPFAAAWPPAATASSTPPSTTRARSRSNNRSA